MSDTDARQGPRLVVVVDGPSGAGKSSISREVARRLGLGYLDTGAMYRALTWWCLQQGIDLDDEPAVTRAAEAMPLELRTDPTDPRVTVDGTDITAAIRESGISSVVSSVARHLPTRAVLIAAQRDHIERGSRPGIIAEGRDLTTVVAPDADVRLLITADEGARLARRSRQVHGGADDEAALAATRDEVVRRDRDDSQVASFLEPTEGVMVLDTSNLTFEQALEAVLTLVESARSRGSRNPDGTTGPHTGE